MELFSGCWVCQMGMGHLRDWSFPVVCAQAHSIRFFLPQRCHSRITAGRLMHVHSHCEASWKGEWAEPCSAELVPRGESEAKQWGRVCPRAWATVLQFMRLGDLLEYLEVLFQPSLGWCMPRPLLGLESGAQLWQGPIAES